MSSRIVCTVLIDRPLYVVHRQVGADPTEASRYFADVLNVGWALDALRVIIDLHYCRPG